MTDSEGSEACVGGSEEKPTNPAPKRVTSSAASVTSVVTASRDADAAACFLCEGGGQLGQTYKGQQMHTKCFNAVRAHNRMTSSDKAARMRADREFYTKPAAWRDRVLPLVVNEGEKRSAKQRALARQTVKEAYNGTEELDDKLLLTLNNYVAYRSFWDRIDAKAAEAAFWHELEAQGTDREDEDGEPRVRRSDIQRERSYKGKRTRREEVAASDPQAEPARRPGDDDLGDGQGDLDDEDLEAPAAEDPSKKPRKEPPALTRRALITHSRKCDSGSGPVDASPTGRLFDGESVKSGVSSQVAALKEKAVLRAAIKNAIAECTNYKSTSTILKKKMKELTPEMESQMEIGPSQVAQDLYNWIDEVKAMDSTVAKMPLRDYPKTREAFERLLQEGVAKDDQARQVVQAMYFLLSQEKQNHRRDASAKRYQVDKLAKTLQSQGFSKPWSKIVASRAYSHYNSEEEEEAPSFVQKQPENFDHEKVTVMPCEGSAAATHECMQKVRANLEEQLTKKMEEMTKTMNKKGWKSAIARVGWTAADGDYSYGLGPKSDYMNDDGAAPLVIGVKAHAWRYGPGEYSMPGMGNLVVALSDDMAINVFKIEPALQQGIALVDLPAFIQTASGQTYLKEHSATVFFNGIGSTVWVPNGFMVALLHLPTNKDATPSFGFALCVSHWHIDWATTCGLTTWQSVADMNMKYLGKNKMSKVYTGRDDLLVRFNTAVLEQLNNK